jgi:hypothetical protein
MRSMGFTVGCDEPLGRGFPQSAQAFRFDHLADVAGAAPSVEGPSFSGEVPPFLSDGAEKLADGAGLPPKPIDKLAPGVDSLVTDGINKEEVGEAVVGLVPVDVVDLVSVWDWPVDGFPGADVSELEAVGVAGGLASEITLAGDVLAVGSLGLWSALSHSRPTPDSPDGSLGEPSAVEATAEVRPSRTTGPRASSRL